MKTNKIHNIKSSGFKAPQDYFDAFDDKLMDKLKNESPVHDIKTSGFEVPKDYFKTLDNTIIKKIESDKPTTKVIPLFNKKMILYATSIAAAVLLLFNLSLFDTNSKPTFDSLDSQSVENYILNENISFSELASLFSDEELNATIFSEDHIDDENIENYLLDYSDIETLLTE
ncbi:hypothetical protein JJL45_07825 [Tamlana sp. s12]|uniref:hypothetical protein n=1 Tax=Tamlana sp. s12 TaxID=1630406 RepID=UPI0007FDAC30|nr:hypothetical protein [Tamlana sp. s12]OBQ55459.1 hypothetical protein VQ01_08330 [Tamlana sp. s12]QQY83880.1 hypothetical protein JJL45_07825 [Tamlana sp. s12]